MLTNLKKEDFSKFVDWAYNLALDCTHSSYPNYNDGVKTKQDFINTALETFNDDNREILLFSDAGQVVGWINYFVIPQDCYIGLEAFNTERNTKLALKEFETYCKDRYKGYTMYMGFPCENTEAHTYFKENGYNLIEASQPNVFHFTRFEPLKYSEKIIKIDKNNYGLFEKLHKHVDGEMYWNVQRIFDNLDSWQIFYYDDAKTQGAIYFTGTKICEIFGVDYSDNRYEPTVFNELIAKCLNVCAELNAEHLYFFCENNESEILSKLGFIQLSKYNCYTLCLT